MKVVFHSTASAGLQTRFAGLESQGLTISSCPETDHGRFNALLTDAEVIWHLLEPLTAAIIGAAPRLRLIHKIGVGVNTIDLEAARRNHVAVCNMPGTNTQAVAEMTVMLMLMALRRATQLDAETRAGKGWAVKGALQDGSGEISGRTVGLVGYGAVSRRLAPILVALGARVLFTCRSKQPDAVGEPRTFNELLTESDVVSLHIPLTAATDRVIDADAIARMKPGAVIINTARGALIDECALTAALRSGHVAAAGLDVFVTEPLPVDTPLLALDNVVVTPHVAYLTRETMERSLSVAAENCRRLATDEDLLHRVV